MMPLGHISKGETTMSSSDIRGAVLSQPQSRPRPGIDTGLQSVVSRQLNQETWSKIVDKAVNDALQGEAEARRFLLTLADMCW